MDNFDFVITLYDDGEIELDSPKGGSNWSSWQSFLANAKRYERFVEKLRNSKVCFLVYNQYCEFELMSLFKELQFGYITIELL